MPSPVSSTAISTRPGVSSASTRTVPSAGVWRTAFTSRFCSTRATRGEHIASPAPFRSETTLSTLVSAWASTDRHRRRRRAHPAVDRRWSRASITPASSWVSSNRSSTIAHQLADGPPHLRDVATEGRRVVDHAVVDRLDHRAERCERRPEIVRDTVVIRSRRIRSASRSRSWAALQPSRPCRPASTPSVSSSGPASSRPMRASEVALAQHPRAARSSRWIASPSPTGDHQRGGDAGADRVDEQDRDQRRVVLAHRTSACASTPMLAIDDRGGEQRDGHEPLSRAARVQQRLRANAAATIVTSGGREQVGDEVTHLGRPTSPSRPRRPVDADAHRSRPRSRPARACRSAPSWLEPVADAPDRQHVPRRRRVVLDLLAQPADVDRDRGSVAVPREVPDVLEQRRAAERDAGRDAMKASRSNSFRVSCTPAHRRRATSSPPESISRSLAEVEDRIASADRRPIGGARRGRARRPRAGENGFGDVVVGAQFEPDDPVGLLAPRGEHDHGRSAPLARIRRNTS